jgi:hypothetical protein
MNLLPISGEIITERGTKRSKENAVVQKIYNFNI